MEAYKRVKSNKGSDGYDGVNFKDIEEFGVEKYISNIQEELENKTYKASPLLRIEIPKSNGKKRPLSIPTIKDRIVQMSCKMVIEPIFEADFEDTSYGFRPKRDAKGAITKIKELLKDGNTEIYDADLSEYFDTIPHDKLLKTLAKRISDSDMLRLIKMWLKAPTYENGKFTGGKKKKVGVPQGGVISPLLSNIYLNLLERIVNKAKGYFQKRKIQIVRYADDFIMMSKNLTEEAIERLKRILFNMDLKVNDEKSELIDATKNSFNFLGFTFRYDKDIWAGKKKYWNIVPSDKSEKKIRENIKGLLKRSIHFENAELVKELNSRIRGWINYFCIKKVSYPMKAQKRLRYYLSMKLFRYYKRKSQRRCKLYRKGALDYLIKKYRLINPATYSMT